MMTPTEYHLLRVSVGLSQVRLAKLLGLTRQTIGARESGTARITPEAAIALKAVVAKQREAHQVAA